MLPPASAVPTKDGSGRTMKRVPPRGGPHRMRSRRPSRGVGLLSCRMLELLFPALAKRSTIAALRLLHVLVAVTDQQDGPATSMGAEAASAGVDVTTTSHPRCDMGGSTKLLSEITVFQPAGALNLPLASVFGGISQRS